MKQFLYVKIFGFFLTAFIFSLLLSAQAADFESTTFSLVEPADTKLMTKEIENVDKAIIATSYKYFTQLSEDQIASFYRSFFTENGFREVKEYAQKGQGLFVFNRGFVEQASLSIHASNPDYDKGGITYFVTFTDVRDLLGLSSYHFRKPAGKSFIPVPQGVAEALQVIQNKPTTVPYHSLYLINGDFDELIAFYIENMPKAGWALKSHLSDEGRCNFYKAFMHEPSYLNKYRELGVNMEEFFPGIEVDVKKAFMYFRRGNQSCFIQITQFRDPPEVLRQMHINPEPLQRYGNIYININSSNKSFEELEKDSRLSLEKHVEDLRRTLGY